jgi:hypothetical protein
MKIYFGWIKYLGQWRAERNSVKKSGVGCYIVRDNCRAANQAEMHIAADICDNARAMKYGFGYLGTQSVQVYKRRDQHNRQCNRGKYGHRYPKNAAFVPWFHWGYSLLYFDYNELYCGL